MNQWEKMVYVSDFMYQRDPEFDPKRPREIGPVSNDRILKLQEEIWVDTDSEDYRNFVMKDELRMNKDFKIVPESIWNFFKEKYGGTPIKRYYRKGYAYGAEIEATLKEIQVVFFPQISKIDQFKEPIKCLPIYMSKHETLKDLKERLVKVLEKNNIPVKSEKDLRVWKLNYSLDLPDLLKTKDQIVESL